MWLCVDRVENQIVVLMDDNEKLLHVSVAEYIALVGRRPAESDVLAAEVEGDTLLSAVYSEEETRNRKEAARGRLNRLFGRK